MEGVFLDAMASRGFLKILVAVKNGVVWKKVPATYRVYIKPSRNYTARSLLQGILTDCGIEAWTEEWRRPPWYREKIEVVVISSGDPRLLQRVVRAIEARGVGRRVNKYPGLLIEALWRLRTPPGTRVRISGSHIRTVEDLQDPLYPPPDLRIVLLEAYSWHGPISSPWEKVGFYTAECCGERRRSSDTYTLIDWLASHRPHVVSARLEVRWSLGIQSYTGSWLWFDPSRNLVSFWGLLEWMRISWLPYHEAHSAAIGKVLTAAEAQEAYRRKYLIDPDAPRYEAFRTVKALASADMAGATRIPSPGLYWNVVQLDYSSLYPSLIHIHNISSETVNNPHCNAYEISPSVNHRICQEMPGLVSTVLGRLVKRRSIIKTSHPRDPRVKAREESIKWILVSGFGYLGYRNSLFGSISAYECVTSYARQALAIAEEESEKAGYKIIHALIDSVFIQPVDPLISLEELMRSIEKRVGVPLKVEAWYRWLYIPSTRQGLGAVNKYYGSLREGGLKLRGITSVRRDAPPLIARTQRAVIKLLEDASDPQDFAEKLLKGLKVVERVREILREGNAPSRLLVIEKRLEGPSKRLTQWRRIVTNCCELIDRIKYVVTSKGPRPVWEGPFTDYDKHYYLKLLEVMVRELPSLDELN